MTRSASRPGTTPVRGATRRLSGSRSRRPGRGVLPAHARGGLCVTTMIVNRFSCSPSTRGVVHKDAPRGRRLSDGGRPPAAPQMDRPTRGDPYRGAVDGRAAVLEPVGAGSVEPVPQQAWATLLWDVETTNPGGTRNVRSFESTRISRSPPTTPQVKQSAPRARGDGPADPTSSTLDRRCSPRTRGWSRGMAVERVRLTVLPAHAGMVP